MSFNLSGELQGRSLKVLDSLSLYSTFAMNSLERHYRSLNSIHPKYQLSVQGKFEQDKNCILKNQEFLKAIIESHIDPDSYNLNNSQNLNIERPKSLLKQFMREWSSMVPYLQQ